MAMEKRGVVNTDKEKTAAEKVKTPPTKKAPAKQVTPKKEEK